MKSLKNPNSIRKALGFRNINQAIEFYGGDDIVKQRRYSDETKEIVNQIMQNDYDNKRKDFKIATKLANKIATEQQIITDIIAKNQEYAEKKNIAKQERKASIISKFFKNYQRPVNAEKFVKYTDGVNKDNHEVFAWKRQYVDVYNIVGDGFISALGTTQELLNGGLSKLFNLLGNLYRKYKTGVFQVDLIGVWYETPEQKNTDGSINLSFLNTLQETLNELWEEKPHKVSVKAFDLTPKSYAGFIVAMLAAMKPPNTKSEFFIFNINVKLIKPLAGGCYSCKGHGKNMKIENLTLHNPYSTNNNCFFRIIEDYLDFKPNKLKCNEIRAEFGIPENDMINMEDAYKIAKKYTKITIMFVTNTMQLILGDPDAEVSVFCLNNHYMRLVGETHKCNDCGAFYQHTHKCNGKTASFYNSKIKRLIKAVEHKDNGLLNHEILHYDIETQYTNINKEHTPYIVGYCHYIDKELVYGEFSGDNCMQEFYDFLKTLTHIKYINAYNGSGYDHYYLFRIKVESDENVGSFILNNGNILSATIHKKKLIDLCRHLTGTLDSNLKSSGCNIAKGKINHNLSVRWEDTSPERKNEVREYLRCDVLGLCELYEKVNEPIYTKYQINLCEKLTLSTNAFDIWRDCYLKEEIYLLDAEKDINARQAIYGARCYKNKNRFVSSEYDRVISGELFYESVFDYIFDADVVSLYPTAMANYPYPVGKEKTTNIYQDGKLGLYKITYKCPKNLLNPILPRKENKKLIWDLLDGEGWYSSVDIESAKSKGYEIKIITGYFWENQAFIFKEYMDEFFQMKANAKKGTPAYSTAKLYLNGLYGKMLQRPNHTKDVIIKSAEEFWLLLNKNIIQEMTNVGNTWLVKYLPKPEFLVNSGAEKPTQLGVFILAYSRAIMNGYYDKCGNTIERLPYYYDTDSLNIHSSCLDNIKIDKSLGGIDDDVGGKVIKAIYIAPKMYAFQYITEDNKLHYHFRGKGVSNNELSWADFELMDENKSKEFTREFQIKKINMKKIGTKDKNCNFFSHRHLHREDTKKTINQNIWSGRKFINDNDSVPHGFDEKFIVRNVKI